jgi:CubicO group peptidase (beta-lactamase class C family)
MTDYEHLLSAELAGWPGGTGAAAIIGAEGVLAAAGPDRAYRWASVTKLLTALVTLDAVGQGQLSLDEPAGPPGSTVRHLLAHASGLAVDSERVLAAPGQRRIYSNYGFEVLGDLLERRFAQPFATRLQEVVLEPLAMQETACPGSAAHGARGPVADLAKLAAELLRPRHFPADLVAQARTPVFADLSGVLPGFGRQEPNHWGLGFEIRGQKSPHWMSPANSASAFGHFGQAGAFCWIDPVADLACVAANDTPFGPWAATAWPQLSTRVLDATSGVARHG